MSIERGPSPEEAGTKKLEAKKIEESPERRKTISEIADKLNLPAEKWRKLGFEYQAKEKDKLERAQTFLDEKITELLSKMMRSKSPEREQIRFDKPDDIHAMDLERIFSDRTTMIDKNGEKVPVEIMPNTQLKLSTISNEIRKSGYYTYETTLFLGPEELQHKKTK